ncbi:19625_t:CDS:2, partial [Racocetra fulgida]
MNQEQHIINIDSDDAINKNDEADPPSKKQSDNFEANQFSYNYLKSFSSVFLYIRGALKKLLGENIQTLTPEKYKVSTKNGTLKTESEYEGSI